MAQQGARRVGACGGSQQAAMKAVGCLAAASRADGLLAPSAPSQTRIMQTTTPCHYRCAWSPLPRSRASAITTSRWAGRRRGGRTDRAPVLHSAWIGGGLRRTAHARAQPLFRHPAQAHCGRGQRARRARRDVPDQPVRCDPGATRLPHHARRGAQAGRWGPLRLGPRRRQLVSRAARPQTCLTLCRLCIF